MEFNMKEEKDIAFECRKARVRPIDSIQSPSEDNGIIVCDFSFSFQKPRFWLKMRNYIKGSVFYVEFSCFSSDCYMMWQIKME